MADKVKHYNGNSSLVRAGTRHEWTQEQIDDFDKCFSDPVYFAETHFKIVHVDKGLIPFKLFPFQKKAIRAIHRGRKLLINASRQVGKCQSLNTKLKIRNKRTGNIEFITGRDFLRLLLKQRGVETEEMSDEILVEMARESSLSGKEISRMPHEERPSA